MSGGEQQMLAMGRGLMMRPRMLMLDEPSLGLSPRFVDEVFDKTVAMARAGLTVLLVEQNAARALEVSDRAYVLELGRNRFEAPAASSSTTPRSAECTSGGTPGSPGRRDSNTQENSLFRTARSRAQIGSPQCPDGNMTVSPG
jgi:energy-coupling factor transporter ATP-binding protein EcfA2